MKGAFELSLDFSAGAPPPCAFDSCKGGSFSTRRNSNRAATLHGMGKSSEPIYSQAILPREVCSSQPAATSQPQEVRVPGREPEPYPVISNFPPTNSFLFFQTFSLTPAQISPAFAAYEKHLARQLFKLFFHFRDFLVAFRLHTYTLWPFTISLGGLFQCMAAPGSHS